MASTRSPTGTSGGAQDRMAGRILGGRYRVLSRLGEGGMGAVYLCEHAVLGRRYAVKVLRPELGDDQELVERFRNEAIAASRIGGENVVDVFDFGEEADGALYYVMEALEGRSLGSIISEEGPMDVPRTLALLEQICRALGAAHARGVVHRDVKPDNVFVLRREDGAERAKVIDFGISQVTLEGRAERLTQAGSVIGTPEYMAPEQAAGATVDHRADVYALGVLAYEMLTGTLPILATTPIATLVAHQTRTPDAPSRRRPGISPEVDALVLAALAKRPEDRPASREAFASRIAAVRTSGLRRPQSTPRQPVDTMPLPAAPREGSRAGGRLVVALVVVLAAIAGAVWFGSRRLAAHDSSKEPSPPLAAPAPAAPRGEPPAAAPAAPPPAPAPAAVPEREAAAPTAAQAPVPGRRGSRPGRSARRSTRDRHLEDPYSKGALKPNPF